MKSIFSRSIRWWLRECYRFDIEEIEQSGYLESQTSQLSQYIAQELEMPEYKAAKLAWLVEITSGKVGYGFWGCLALRELFWQWTERIDILKVYNECLEWNEKGLELPDWFYLVENFCRKWPHFGSIFDHSF